MFFLVNCYAGTLYNSNNIFGHTFMANMYQSVFNTDVVIETIYFCLCTLCLRHFTFNAVSTVAITI